MSELAESISENTRIVDTFFLDHNISAPSFDTGSPLKMVINDEKVAGARFAAIAAMHELKCLMLGPTESLMSVEVRVAMDSARIIVFDKHLVVLC